MSTLLSRWSRRFGREDGFTLVEQLVVIFLISVTAFIPFYIVSSLLSSSLGSLNIHQQISTSSGLNVYAGDRDWELTAGDLAPASPPGTTDLLELSGDQMAWCYTKPENHQRWCTRLFYVARLQELFQQSAPVASWKYVRPVRGPNETVTARADCPAPCYRSSGPTDPLYDPILDRLDQGSASVLADHASTEANGGTALTTTTAPFRYLTPLANAVSGIPAQAHSGSVTSGQTAQAQIGEVDIQLYLQPANPAPDATVAARQNLLRLYIAPTLTPSG